MRQAMAPRLAIKTFENMKRKKSRRF